MILKSKNNNQIIYSFGIDREHLDGEFKIDLDDILNSKIIKSSKFIPDRMDMKALITLLRKVKNNDLEDFEYFQS